MSVQYSEVERALRNFFGQQVNRICELEAKIKALEEIIDIKQATINRWLDEREIRICRNCDHFRRASESIGCCAELNATFPDTFGCNKFTVPKPEMLEPNCDDFIAVWKATDGKRSFFSTVEFDAMMVARGCDKVSIHKITMKKQEFDRIPASELLPGFKGF